MAVQTGSSYTWWKIILGAFLIVINVRLIVFPETQTLKADNASQELGMMVMGGAMILLGGWLLISGIQAGRRSPPVSK